MCLCARVHTHIAHLGGPCVYVHLNAQYIWEGSVCTRVCACMHGSQRVYACAGRTQLTQDLLCTHISQHTHVFICEHSPRTHMEVTPL